MAGQVWSVSADGGDMYSDQLSNVLRTALQPSCKYRQFCDAKDGTPEGFGRELHNGDTFNWNVYSDVATQGTTLGETDVIPETKFTITQGSLTVTERANSVPYTSKLDDLSLHPVKEIINKVLKNDAKKAMDIAAEAQFQLSPLTVTPGSSGSSATTITLETSGTPTATVTKALTDDHVKKIIDQMKERDIPPYMDDCYFAIGRPAGYRTLKDALESLHTYVDAGFQMILYGEIGKYEGCRFVEQTNIADPGYGSSNASKIHFFGEDTVAEGIVIPEEVRGKIPTEYGRSKGVAWYALNGFGLVHTAAAQARVMRWVSAA